MTVDGFRLRSAPGVCSFTSYKVMCGPKGYNFLVVLV